MSLDPYAICPCGSGKKFKWCCQPIYAGINHAFQQEEEGQHDSALKIMNQVTQEHSGNPEAWGQLARLRYGRGELEEAEKALEKAFAINPTYPYGLLLQAVFRFQEGELAGALLLARRAAEAYAPEAKTYLADVYSIIFECEMKRNRPVAARAALRIVVHGRPDQAELRDNFENLFGKEGRLPACAQREYQLLAPPTAVGERRTAWNKAFAEAAASPRLSKLAPAFEKLTKQDENDGPAWFNLALVRAWLGENQAALDALDRYFPLETDDERGEIAGALAEVLRCGLGLEEVGDYAEYAFSCRITNAEPINKLIQDWHRENRLVPLPVDQQGVFFAMVLDFGGPAVIAAGESKARSGRLAGYLMIANNLFRVWGSTKDSIHKLRDEVRSALQLGLTDAEVTRAPVLFEDVVSEALIFPVNAPKEEAQQKVIDHLQKYFEDRWIHQPRRALSGVPPVDAAGHPALRKRLLGVIRFLQDCAAGGLVAGYDFDRLRRKLGLLAGAPPTTNGVAGETTLDIGAMGPAELAALPVDKLSDDQVEQAFHAALRLDAAEIAALLGKALAVRPPQVGKDRYPIFNFLVQHALKEGNSNEALDHVNAGERIDCEANEGKRRNDYELRRGQVHVKRGEPEQAAEVFQRLIDRVPDNLKYRGSAAESMLTLKQGARALRFAEEGLAAARQANDRDSEGYLMELVEAAKRVGK